jgi:hypothetical protein
VTNISKYTMNGKKDIYSKIIPNTSLTQMMKLQVDFVNEETLLESFTCTLRVRAGKSPPGHPEVAGDGIKFVWGAGKVCFRFHPLQDKKKQRVDLLRWCIIACLIKSCLLKESDHLPDNQDNTCWHINASLSRLKLYMMRIRQSTRCHIR